MTSSSADREGQAEGGSSSGTCDSVSTGGTAGTGVTVLIGVAGVTEGVHLERTGTFGCSGDPDRTEINALKRSCVCRCCLMSYFRCSEISFRYPRISGWISVNAEVNKLCWTENTHCKGLHATLVICEDG